MISTFFVAARRFREAVLALKVVVDVLYLHLVLGCVCYLRGTHDRATHYLYLLFIPLSISNRFIKTELSKIDNQGQLDSFYSFDFSL